MTSPDTSATTEPGLGWPVLVRPLLLAAIARLTFFYLFLVASLAPLVLEYDGERVGFHPWFVFGGYGLACLWFVLFTHGCGGWSRARRAVVGLGLLAGIGVALDMSLRTQWGFLSWDLPAAVAVGALGLYFVLAGR